MINVNLKGKNYERKIAKYINKVLGTFLRRTPMSGGMELKGDILEINPDSPMFPYHFELKNHKKLAIPKWWEQCESDCPPSKDPVLIVNMKGRDMAIIDLDLFLGLNISKQKQKGEKHETKYNAENRQD